MTELSVDTDTDKLQEGEKEGELGDNGNSTALNDSIDAMTPSTLRSTLRCQRALLAENAARQAGTFFTSLEDLCNEVQVRVELGGNSTHSFEGLCRSSAQAKAIDSYTDTIDAIERTDRQFPAYYSARTRVIQIVKNIVESTKNLFTPRTSAGEGDQRCFTFTGNSSYFTRQAMDVLGRTGGEVAHLVPHEPACAVFYATVVRCALGFDKTATLQSQQCMVHGVKAGRFGQKMQHTGLKHNKNNKFQFVGQAEVFDKDPWFLIVPAMNIDDIKAWKGEEYKAICLVGCSQNGVDSRQALQNAEACPDDLVLVHQALSVLREFSIALAIDLSATDFATLPPNMPRRTAKKVAKRAAELEESKKKLRDERLVTVLELKKKTEDFHVAMASFNCDPFLLAARAAVNLSKRLGRPLLPACTVKDVECEESDCEGCPNCDIWIEKREPFVPTFEEIFLEETWSVVSDLAED